MDSMNPNLAPVGLCLYNTGAKAGVVAAIPLVSYFVVFNCMFYQLLRVPHSCSST